MSKIKAICLDLDGVLLDAKDLHKDALNRALSFNKSEPISEEEHLTIFDGLPTKKKLEMLESMGRIHKRDFEFINKLKQDLTSNLVMKKCQPIAEHLVLLSTLKVEGYALGLCSNSIRATVDAAMEVSCLGKFFDFTLSNEDVSKAKPNPEIYNIAIAKLGLKPEEVLIVEDNKNGIEAARASGAHVLEVTDGVFQVTLDFVKNKIKEIENESN